MVLLLDFHSPSMEFPGFNDLTGLPWDFRMELLVFFHRTLMDGGSMGLQRPHEIPMGLPGVPWDYSAHIGWDSDGTFMGLLY